MDRGLVEHFDEPEMNRGLYRFLCIFGILKIFCKPSSSIFGHGLVKSLIDGCHYILSSFRMSFNIRKRGCLWRASQLLAKRERFRLQLTLTPDTWSRPFGTCICSTCCDQSFSELVVILPDYALRISLGTFSISLWHFSGVTFQLVKLLCLAENNWWGFSDRNAHIDHII